MSAPGSLSPCPTDAFRVAELIPGCACAGGTLPELDDVDRRIARSTSHVVLAHGARIIHDPGLVIRFAETVRLEQLGALGLIVKTSASCRDAVLRARQCAALPSNAARLRLKERVAPRIAAISCISQKRESSLGGRLAAECGVAT
ncbi:AraC family transcriptional regulator ligand-binding domain-containing protein [Sorangium sp. So ce118]